VARLATVRLPVRICDRLGHRLAEIVDDTVTASADAQPTRRFREVEVEVSADAPARLLAAAVSRLAEADCTARSATPKLVRALGEPARRPPDVVVEPLPADPSVEDLIRHALAAGVAQILRHDPGVRLGDDPEDVHQLRVATRRLRSDLRTFAPLLDRSPVAGIRAELGWLATVVGAVRDIDVLTARLRAAGRTLPDLDAPAVTALLCRVDGEAGTARAAMLEALRSPRYLHLLDALVALAAAPPPAPDVDPAGRPPAELAADLVRRPWRRLAEAVAALPPQPPDEALHRIRILAKRCRYATEAVSPVIGKRAARFADRLAELQTVLGDHHDTTVAESWLRTAARDEPATAVAAGELLAGERRRRAELRRRWPLAWQTASRGRLRRGR
jgi:CHAD domain-containing protein